MSATPTESRKALHELIDFLREVDERWAGPEWECTRVEDVAEAHRALMHMLQGGLASWFEDDPRRPRFQRIVSPTRKFTGDNPDAIYFDCAIREDLRYVVRGNMAGAQYVSITLESGTQEGLFSKGTVGVLNDTMFDVDADGSFEIFLGGEERERNWLPLPENTSRVTTRHYIEAERYAASDPARFVPLSIECLDTPDPSPRMDDAGVAAGIRRAMNFAKSRTLLFPRGMKVPFVSEVPNRFVQPVKPGAFSFAAFDAAYTQTSWQLADDEALVIRGRWPECRTGTVCLWTPHLQTLDYANRRVSLNRAQTRLDADGSWKMILAHRDPGHPNWLDTEGRSEGSIFVRFMLPEGEIDTPTGELVKFDEL